MGNRIDKNTARAIFLGKADCYNGIQVDSKVEPCTSHEFPTKLADSLSKWTAENKRGIWFKIHLDCTHWVPVLIQNGFRYHHAQDTFVVMLRWLPQTETCTVPKYPHNYIGVGAFMVNDNREVLVVKERYAIKSHWKLPGGYVERAMQGEDLAVAAQREVLEETGIEARFVSVVAFRHIHQVNFQCSDIYFICQLRPLGADIRKCDRELTECRWMPIEQYCNETEINEFNRHIARAYLEHERHGFALAAEVVDSNDRQHMVYTVKQSVGSEEQFPREQVESDE